MAVAATTLVFSGCVTTGEKIDEVNGQLIESAQIYTEAIVETLEHDQNPSPESQAALETARQLQDVTGKPSPDEKIDIEKLIQNPQAELEDRKQADWDAQAEKRAYEKTLIDQGKIYEAQHRKTLIQRIWAWTIGTFGIGGLIALAVFCPAALPIIFNILSWIVTGLIRAIPSLMNFFHVVGKATYENTVKGIGDARAQLKTIEQHSPDKTFTAAEVRKLLDDALVNTTEDDRAVSEYVRSRYNV